MKKILFVPPEPWYVQNHMEYFIRYFGHKYIMDQSFLGSPPYEEATKINPMTANPDEYDLIIPLLPTHPHLDQVKYKNKLAAICWEPREGIWNSTVLVAATTPIVVKAMENEGFPYVKATPGIDINLFRPMKQAKRDDLMHIGVVGAHHNVRHQIKDVVMPLLDIKGVKFDFYARNFFHDRLNDIEQAGGQPFFDNIEDGNKVWVGLPNVYNRMDMILKVDADPGLTFPIMEAAACGVPFVATQIGIEQEFADAGGGIVIDADERDLDGNGRGWYLGNIDKVVERARAGIIKLRDNPETRRQMGSDARNHLVHNYSWAEQLPNWEKFFEKALEYAK